VVKAQRALGKLLEPAPRVSRFDQVDLKDSANLRAGLSWQRQDEVRDEDEALLGCYVLRTDRSELNPEWLWNTSILLRRAEDDYERLTNKIGSMHVLKMSQQPELW
jgi:hypothetical protein